MEKKKETQKNSNHFEGEYDNLCNEMVKEIIKKLDSIVRHPDIGLVVCDVLDDCGCRYLKQEGKAAKRIDLIVKIAGHWVFAIQDIRTNTADCFPIEGRDDITIELLDYDNLLSIMYMLEDCEKTDCI